MDNLPALIAKQLTGKRLILGVCGGIAVVKSLELARLLTKAGTTVHTVMTHSAQKMIAPEVFTALTGETAWVDQWQENSAGMMAHLALSRGADGILIAPATANILAKLAGGIADDLLTTLCLGRPLSCPLMVAPAMNVAMWEQAQTQANVQKLRQQGVIVFPPESGLLACGEMGAGRLMPVDDLLWYLARTLIHAQGLDALAQKKVIVTLGPTIEMIDPVRGLTNISSGKMGNAIAQASWLMGARVEVMAGGGIAPFLSHPEETPHLYLNHDESLRWNAASDARTMLELTLSACQRETSEMLIAVAAVADYRAAEYATQKIKKANDSLTLNLSKNPDILRTVAELSDHRPRKVVGFAAESERLLEFALTKLNDKQLDAIIANEAATAFGTTTNEGWLIVSGKPPLALPMQSKAEMAWQILTTLSTLH
jgi:phosphopantothenoylcysteine decarboxylase/phosphopantothenate--cysteine ligase